MNTRGEQFQAEIVVIRKVALERNQNCLAFLIEGFFSSIFLFILDRNLVLLQFPVIVAFFTLYVRPSFSKHLLLQQYIGLAAIVISAIKSLFILINMVIYLLYFFDGSDLPQLYTSSGTASSIRVFSKNPYLFPDLAPRSGAGSSTFLAGVLIVIFVLMALFEILSIYVFYYVIQKTQRIIQKIKAIREPEMPEGNVTVQVLGNNNEDREESMSLQPGAAPR